MGGNALKNTHTVRKITSEYKVITREIFNKIYEHTTFEPYLVKCYRNKETHGDADILIKTNENNNAENILKFIKDTFHPNEYLKNGNVISFNYEDFQIDFILIAEEMWGISKDFFDFDSSGNIMGKTFHKFGLSYGWNGLFYKFRNFNGRLSQNILISNNSRKIFEFADYDYDRYLQGFETLEDIMRFTINTKYFDAQIFQMSNLKSIDKKRNRKRKSYHIFLKYLEDNNIDVRYDFHSDKELYLPMIDNAFPEADLIGKLYDFKIKDRESKILSQKFNGDIVMSWLPDLVGKELGHAITNFKKSFEFEDDYREFILNASFDLIKKEFMNTYNG